eukprot:6482083-Amphidinium_carterae.2
MSNHVQKKNHQERNISGEALGSFLKTPTNGTTRASASANACAPAADIHGLKPFCPQSTIPLVTPE